MYDINKAITRFLSADPRLREQLAEDNEREAFQRAALEHLFSEGSLEQAKIAELERLLALPSEGEV